MDKLTKEQRHRCMSAIKSRNTKPEILVRKFLFSRGFRYRLNHPRLPGHPDLVLRKYRTVIFVNGCFWHGHEGCRYATKPQSNSEFWEAKIKRNQHRDEVTAAHLEALGWTVITIWECELRGKDAAHTRIDRLAIEIQEAGRKREAGLGLRRKIRKARETEKALANERQAALEAEICKMYPIPKKVKTASKEID